MVANLCRPRRGLLTAVLQDRFIEGSDIQAFNGGDCVETVSFDHINFRIVTASHNGAVKMFRLDRDGTGRLRFLNLGPLSRLNLEVSLLWTVDLSEAIPRFAHFVNRGEDIIIYALETGEM